MDKTDENHNKKSIRVGKIMQLTNSYIIPNSSGNKMQYLDKNDTLKNEVNKINIFNSYNVQRKEEINKSRKKTDIYKKGNFIINNKTSNNILPLTRKNTYSKTVHNKEMKIMNLYENENIKTYDMEKNNGKKYKNLKLSLNYNTVNSKGMINDNNKIFKNMYHIKTASELNNDLNRYSINTITVKPQMTTESTKSSFNPYLPQEKKSLSNNRLIKTKLKKNISKSKLKMPNSSEFNWEYKIKNNYKEVMKLRQKYPFILHPHPLMEKKFIDLPKNIKRNNKKYFDIVKNENNKMFNQYFSVIAKEKFSKKFQNIGNLFDFKNFYKQKNKNETFESDIVELEENENTDSLINEKIVSGYVLLKELKNKEYNNIKSKRKLTKKSLFNKFKRSFIFLSSKLSNISIFMNEIIEQYRKPKNSYFFPYSHDLFFAIKAHNITLSEKILNSHKHIVLDFDYFGMTALHLAAKYNFYQIIPKLFEYGTHMDDINYIGDTPLLISIKHNFFTSTLFLLLYSASPFIKDKDGKNAIDYSKKDFKLNNIMKKICLLHYVSCFRKTKNKIEFIQKEFGEYILCEYKNDLENEAYNIIHEKLEFFKRKSNNN